MADAHDELQGCRRCRRIARRWRRELIQLQICCGVAAGLVVAGAAWTITMIVWTSRFVDEPVAARARWVAVTVVLAIALSSVPLAVYRLLRIEHRRGRGGHLHG